MHSMTCIYTNGKREFRLVFIHRGAFKSPLVSIWLDPYPNETCPAVAPFDFACDLLGFDGQILDRPLRDSLDLPTPLTQGALVIEVKCPVVGHFYPCVQPIAVGADGHTKGYQSVFGGPLRLINEPVVVVGLVGLGVQEHHGLRHGAWYGPSVDPTM